MNFNHSTPNLENLHPDAVDLIVFENKVSGLRLWHWDVEIDFVQTCEHEAMEMYLYLHQCSVQWLKTKSSKPIRNRNKYQVILLATTKNYIYKSDF